jgi:hypothetical protein
MIQAIARVLSVAGRIAPRRALAGFCLLLLPTAALAGVPQAFLIQNSGWMEPFYTDPKSSLKPLVAAIVEAVADPGDEIYVSAFSQSTDYNESPKRVYPNAQNIPPRQAIAALGLARKGLAGALADTDFQEAVSRVVLDQFHGKPGIIWIVTNNRNSPGNDQDTARRNQEFYDLLHNEPGIARTLAYPLAMPVYGKIYPKAQGLMVYALAYGRLAEGRLLELVEQPRLKNVLTGLPVRLKPLDRDSVRLSPRQIVDAPGVKIRLAEDRKTSILEVDASSRQPSVTIQAELENLFYPYRINAAKLSARFVGDNIEYPLHMVPETIRALSPGGKQELSVSFPIPYSQIPSIWSLSQFKRLGTQLILSGVIEITLDDQQLALGTKFVSQLQENFPNDPISSTFAPSKNVQRSSVSVPLSIRVNYPVYPIVMLIGLGFSLLAVIGLVWRRLSRPWPVVVIVDGAARKLLLKPLQTVPVMAGQGEAVGEIKRGLFGPKIVRVAAGHRIQLTR